MSVLFRFLLLSRLPNHRCSSSVFHHTSFLTHSEKPPIGVALTPVKYPDLSKRFKYKRTKETDKEDEDDDDDLGDEDLEKSSKVVTGHMTSLRADLVLKTGLGTARNKIEKLFYESRVRVNGSKIPKKSYKVNVGDEVDVIQARNPMNDKFLNISRVEILSAIENKSEDGLLVKMRRFKNLMVDNYSKDPWNES